MLRRFLLICFLIGLTAAIQQAFGQLIYYSDSFGRMFTVDISSGTCEVSLLGNLEFNSNDFVPTDLAFHPNGNLYATDGIGLFQINPTSLNVTYIGPHNTAGTDFVNALVCNSDGVMFAADTRLFTVDINNGSTTDLGFLTCESAGDLAFNDNDLYLACQQNNLLKVNIDDPGASQIIGTMSAANPFFGIVTFATECSDVQTFGTAGNEFYQIDVSNANTTLVCTLTGAMEVFGAAMETDFIASDCDFVVDLDFDNNSGALGYDYFADTLCGQPIESFIADEDVSVIAEGFVETVVVSIVAGQDDGADEQLLLNSGANFTVTGSLTNTITMTNDGAGTADDITLLLESIVYVNTANPYTAGTREVEVQFFAENDQESNIANAFITLLESELISIDLGPDQVWCEGEIIELNAEQPDAETYLWNDGSNNPNLVVDVTGTYSVTVTNTCGNTATDEVFIEFLAPAELLEIGPDTTLCPGSTLALDATLIDGEQYEWSDGSTEPTLTVESPGLYAVSVTTTSCGLQTDALFVEFQDIPTGSLFPDDTLACNGVPLLLNASFPDALTYAWQDGSVDSVFSVTTAGYFEVTVTFLCGTYEDGVQVAFNDYDFSLDLGRDTSFCFGEEVSLDGASPFAVSYLWQDGSTEETYIVNETGNYSLTISDGCTEVSDQVYYQMTSCCNVFVPNVFSPDFDGTNDNFQTYSNCVFPKYQLRIFNRWGGIVFESDNQNTRWDGLIKGKEAQQGVYVWVLEYNDGLEDQTLSGDVTLVR